MSHSVFIRKKNTKQNLFLLTNSSRNAFFYSTVLCAAIFGHKRGERWYRSSITKRLSWIDKKMLFFLSSLDLLRHTDMNALKYKNCIQLWESGTPAPHHQRERERGCVYMRKCVLEAFARGQKLFNGASRRQTPLNWRIRKWRQTIFTFTARLPHVASTEVLSHAIFLSSFLFFKCSMIIFYSLSELYVSIVNHPI